MSKQEDDTLAAAGPDYSAHRKSVRAMVAEIRKQDDAAMDAYVRERYGYYTGGMALRDEAGRTVKFMKSPPKSRVQVINPS